MASPDAPLRQSTSELFMITPSAFGFNAQAAEDNHFMADGSRLSPAEVRARVVAEHAELVRVLREEAGLTVHLFDHDDSHGTPDAVFPNNWFSTTRDGRLALYPMKTPNRRAERRPDIVAFLRSKYPADILDLTDEETHGRALEGTGSLVLDHLARVAYVAISERADRRAAERWARATGYRVVPFVARDARGRPVYHTNVVMSVGTSAAIVCREAMDPGEYDAVAGELSRAGRVVIDIDLRQMGEMAGNALEVTDGKGENALCMSERAWESLGEAQRDEVRRHWANVHAVAIPTIEEIGGGSVRCCMAELF